MKHRALSQVPINPNVRFMVSEWGWKEGTSSKTATTYYIPISLFLTPLHHKMKS